MNIPDPIFHLFMRHSGIVPESSFRAMFIAGI